MKIALIGNQARAVSNFWTVLIRLLIAKGHEVICCVPPAPMHESVWEERLAQTGATIQHYTLHRKGLNPYHDVKTLLELQRFLKHQQPDVLFASTIKPVIYAPLAAFFSKTPPRRYRHVMITGLGYMFEADSFIKKRLRTIACLLYRIAFSCVDTVFFQNNADKALFTKLGVLPNRVNVGMCPGTGVDLHHFQQAPLPNGPAPIFLFVGRLLKAKGLHELYEAARLLKAKHPAVRIQLLGPAEYGPGGIPLAIIHKWHDEGVIEYLGETDDVRPFVQRASVLVLPSWREGVSTCLMEGMSMGRPLIATDVPGCQEVVINGKNGYLVPVRNPQQLAATMELFVLDPSLLVAMGTEGRKLAETAFNATLVAEQLIHDMHIV